MMPAVVETEPNRSGSIPCGRYGRQLCRQSRLVVTVRHKAAGEFPLDEQDTAKGKSYTT